MSVRILIGRKTCAVCDGQIMRRGTRVKYCSHSCYHKSQKGSFPNRSPRQRLGATIRCERCSSEFYRKPSALGTHSFCSRTCSNLFNLERFSVRASAAPTSLEAILYAELEAAGVDHERQRPIAGFVVDAYLPAMTTAIEVDGEYWHSLTENKHRDRRKDAALRDRGIRVIRISERAARTDIRSALEAAGVCR